MEDIDIVIRAVNGDKDAFAELGVHLLQKNSKILDALCRPMLLLVSARKK